MDSLRWRRHRAFLGLVIVGLLLLVVVFGDLRITAITSSERPPAGVQSTLDIPGTVDLFDYRVVHDIAVRFDLAEYQQMLDTYRNDDEKAFIQATVTIDGTTLEQAGLRLKGNSTLMSLRGSGQMREMRDQFMQMFLDENGTPVPLPSCLPPGFDPFAFAGPPGGPGGPQATPVAGGPPRDFFGGNISPDDPASLPWLISFDELVDGRRYQGQAEIAVRPVLMNEAMLNEALALNLVGIGGEPTQRAAYSSFVVNGSPPTMRLIVESPGDAFAAENFANEGVLYKALSTGRFAYLGEDPTAYETAFDQETRRGYQDLKPLISLLRWVEEASDEEFAAEIDQHVDVASLARYIAIQALLGNWDDMGGPGQNYYLWYDLETERFTVLTWDLNLALTDFAMGQDGPGAPEGGEGPGGPGPGAPEAGRADFDMKQIFECLFPDGPPPGMSVPMPSFGGNPLKDRFLAAPAFQDLYAREYQSVYDALFGNDRAVAELDRLAAVARASGLIEAATLETEIDAIRSRLRTQEALGPRPVPAAGSGTPVAETPVAATPISMSVEQE